MRRIYLVSLLILQLLLSYRAMLAQANVAATEARLERQIQTGDFRGARNNLKTDLRQYPRNAGLWNLLGIAETELNECPEARAAFEQGLKIEPRSVALNENMGLLFYRTSDYVQAKKCLARATQLGSRKPGVLFSLAASKLRTGEPAQALIELLSLELALSEMPDYWNERGRAELATNATSAEQSFERALELAPANVTALNGAAVAAGKEGLDEKALAYLIRARAAAPDDVPTLLHFAGVCIRRDLGPDAIAALDHARSLQPSNASALYLLGRAEISVENWQQAFDLFSEFSRHYPNFAPTYYALGWIDVKLNRVSDARRQLEHCLRLQPALSDARYELAELNYDDGQIEVAKRMLAAVLRENPHHAKANMTMGDILMRQGNLEAAHKSLETAIEDDPKLAAAHYKLAVLLLREHKSDEAAREKQLAARLNAETDRASKTQLRLLLPAEK